MVDELGLTASNGFAGTIRPKLLRRVGPTQVARITLATSVDQTGERNAESRIALGVSVLSTLGIWVCARRSIAPRRARVQRRGRPIREDRGFGGSIFAARLSGSASTHNRAEAPT